MELKMEKKNKSSKEHSRISSGDREQKEATNLLSSEVPLTTGMSLGLLEIDHPWLEKHWASGKGGNILNAIKWGEMG